MAKEKKKFSSGHGWAFMAANQPKAKAKIITIPPDEQKVEICLEKRKNGKNVTLISKIVMSEADLKAFAKKLKASCGVGGTQGVDNIELQGDCRQKVADHLSGLGFSVKQR